MSKPTKAVLEAIEKARKNGMVTSSLQVDLTRLAGVEANLPDPEFGSESEFQDWVVERARSFGWTVAHFRSVCVVKVDKKGRERKVWQTPVEADGDGFPDLVLVRRGVQVVAELKFGNNKLTDKQRFWLMLFAEVHGVLAFEWRPADLAEIRRVLA